MPRDQRLQLPPLPVAVAALTPNVKNASAILAFVYLADLREPAATELDFDGEGNVRLTIRARPRND